MQSQDETPTLQTSWSLHLKDQDKLKSSDMPSAQYEYEEKIKHRSFKFTLTEPKGLRGKVIKS